ncbi:hypothetical protein L6V77_00715 [Myxococcota bacterium]|nr:hypothetical protein [Myxococcota bacterium]
MTKLNMLRAALVASALTPALAQAQAVAAATPEAGAQATVAPASPPSGDAPAKAPEGEAWPVSASVSVRYGFNHANFTPTESDAPDYGTQNASVSVSASYPFLEKYSVDVSLSASKELADSYYGANSSQTSIRGTDFGDSSISVGGEFYTIPVVDIAISGNLSGTIPTSKASQAADIYTTVGPGLSLSWRWERLSLGADIGASYTFAKYPTVHIQRDTANDNANKSGVDTGEALGLWGIDESFRIGLKIVEGLNFSTSYSMSHSTIATEGKADEAAAEFAQTGQQWSIPSHGVSFGLSWKFLEKSTLGVGMSTRQSLYNKRGDEVTVPIFDFETNTRERTKYSVSLSQAF